MHKSVSISAPSISNKMRTTTKSLSRTLSRAAISRELKTLVQPLSTASTSLDVKESLARLDEARESLSRSRQGVAGLHGQPAQRLAFGALDEDIPNTEPAGQHDGVNGSLAHLDNGSLSAHWMLTIQLWNQHATAMGVHQFLQENGCRKVLDASGGSGDCVLHLANTNAYELAYNDADTDMVNLTRARLTEAGHSNIPLHTEFWNEMPGRVVGEGTYDCVMIRGNSLPYVASWNESCSSLDSKQGRKDLVKSLEGAFRMLKPGGILLVDKSPNDSHGCFAVNNEGVVDGKPIKFCWTFVNDKPKMTRKVTPLPPLTAAFLDSNSLPFTSQTSPPLACDCTSAHTHLSRVRVVPWSPCPPLVPEPRVARPAVHLIVLAPLSSDLNNWISWDLGLRGLRGYARRALTNQPSPPSHTPPSRIFLYHHSQHAPTQSQAKHVEHAHRHQPLCNPALPYAYTGAHMSSLGLLPLPRIVPSCLTPCLHTVSHSCVVCTVTFSSRCHPLPCRVVCAVYHRLAFSSSSLSFPHFFFTRSSLPHLTSSSLLLCSLFQWHQFNQIGDAVHEKVSHSLMITDELLLGCIDEAGYKGATNITLESEETYKTFCARRPE